MTIGVAVLEKFDVPHYKYWYWIGAAALLGFTVLFNVLFTLSLMYLNRKLLRTIQGGIYAAFLYSLSKALKVFKFYVSLCQLLESPKQ